MAFEGSAALLKRTQNFVEDHRRLYLESGGTAGHIVDFTHAGGRGLLPSLLLKTVGRHSGQTRIAPLIYGLHRDRWVIVGSKGGAPEHPAWYLNLTAAPTVEFQIATQAFRATWSLADEAERETVWTRMVDLYPPYATYVEAAGSRSIPLILLHPGEPVAIFRADA